MLEELGEFRGNKITEKLSGIFEGMPVLGSVCERDVGGAEAQLPRRGPQRGSAASS